jgi:hypothetical protein
MGRYKTLVGPRLRARGFAARQSEAAIGVAVLNRMLVPDARIQSVASRSPHNSLGLGPSCHPSGSASTPRIAHPGAANQSVARPGYDRGDETAMSAACSDRVGSSDPIRLRASERAFS